MVPTSKENLEKITKVFHKLEETVANLAGRWLDESQYEDIADYQKVIEKELPEGFKITKMHSRPFGFSFTIGTEAEYKMQCSMKEYSWKRVK